LPPESLPAWGAWIEIILISALDIPVVCRSPRGERGLKLVFDIATGNPRQSLPAWGAWIEIFGFEITLDIGRVAPRVGSVD